jgi:hypothetical protein
MNIQEDEGIINIAGVKLEMRDEKRSRQDER